MSSRGTRPTRLAVVVAANAVALLAAGLVAWRIAARASTIREALDVEEARFVEHGFVRIASNALTATDTVEADGPRSSCFVAIATGKATVRVTQGTTSAEAMGSVAWCACAPGRVSIEATAPPAADGGTGIALLQAEARAIGGPLARAWTRFTPGAWAEGGAECADEALDGWVADGHAARTSAADVVDTWFSRGRASLRSDGLRPIAVVPADRPFGAVDGPAGECMLAVGEAGDPISLRATGGAMLVASAAGAAAWCDSRATTLTVWHERPAPVVVLAAPARHVGGLLGMGECARAAGIAVAPEAAWLRDDDLVWDAEAMLRASTLADVVAGALPAEAGPVDARIAALAWSHSARVAAEPTTAAVACDPVPDESALVHETVCSASAPVAWWRRTVAAGGGAHEIDRPAAAARAPLPLWLSVLEARSEPDAVARIPELITLARRLARGGFLPTVLEGVTELPDGVRVTGRAGEDAVVAVGIAPRPPWVFPYGNGVRWDLGDAPVIVALEPGASVKLVSSPQSSAALETRRTVVFRRTAHP
jgi:hypothetical protein